MDPQKRETVSFLADKIKGTPGIYLGDFKGMDVASISELRNKFREKGIWMKVAKNTLLKRAFADNDISGLEKALAGPTALILSDMEDPMMPAKEITAFMKGREKGLAVKQIYIDGQTHSGDQVEALSKMPGKRELQAQVVQIALGAGGNVIGLIRGPGGKIAGQIKALMERLEGTN